MKALTLDTQKIYTNREVRINNALADEAKTQHNIAYTERRRAAEDRAEAKRQASINGDPA